MCGRLKSQLNTNNRQREKRNTRKADFVSCVLDFCSCCNKIPRSWWLRTETYSLTALETRRPRSVPLGQNQGVGRAVLPLEVLGENPVLSVPASGGCRNSLTCGPITQSSSPAPSNPCMFHLYITFSFLYVSNLPLPCSYKHTCDSV